MDSAHGAWLAGIAVPRVDVDGLPVLQCLGLMLISSLQ